MIDYGIEFDMCGNCLHRVKLQWIVEEYRKFYQNENLSWNYSIIPFNNSMQWVGAESVEISEAFNPIAHCVVFCFCVHMLGFGENIIENFKSQSMHDWK